MFNHNEAEMLSAMYCNHANENPHDCDCVPNCYCKFHTCKNKPSVEYREELCYLVFDVIYTKSAKHIEKCVSLIQNQVAKQVFFDISGAENFPAALDTVLELREGISQCCPGWNHIIVGPLMNTQLKEAFNAHSIRWTHQTYNEYCNELRFYRRDNAPKKIKGWITLTNSLGDRFLINTRNITMIEKRDSGSSVEMVKNSVVVKEAPEEINRIIIWAGNQ